MTSDRSIPPVTPLLPAERAERSAPRRTCVGCRRVDRADVLLRVVVDRPAHGDSVAGVSVVADPGRRLPGRGAWIHRDERCLQAAERRRAFGRALRVPGGARKSGGDSSVDIERLRQYLASDLTGPSDERAGGPIVSSQ